MNLKWGKNQVSPFFRVLTFDLCILAMVFDNFIVSPQLCWVGKHVDGLSVWMIMCQKVFLSFFSLISLITSWTFDKTPWMLSTRSTCAYCLQFHNSSVQLGQLYWNLLHTLWGEDLWTSLYHFENFQFSICYQQIPGRNVTIIFLQLHISSGKTLIKKTVETLKMYIRGSNWTKCISIHVSLHL